VDGTVLMDDAMPLAEKPCDSVRVLATAFLAALCMVEFGYCILPDGSSVVPAAFTDSEAEIWERIIHPRGDMSRETAGRILELEFTDEDRARMHTLAERNRRGELSDEEADELDHYCRVGTLLSVLKARARRVLKSRKSAS
jgi:hypothetical protein